MIVMCKGSRKETFIYFNFFIYAKLCRQRKAKGFWGTIYGRFIIENVFLKHGDSGTTKVGYRRLLRTGIIIMVHHA